MAGTPRFTLDQSYIEGLSCPICGQDALQVRRLERYPDFVNCGNCESAFVAEDDGERVMYGKIPASYPSTIKFALNEWVWPEAIERKARTERTEPTPGPPPLQQAPPEPPGPPPSPEPVEPPRPPAPAEEPTAEQDPMEDLWPSGGTTPLDEELAPPEGPTDAQVTPIPSPQEPRGSAEPFEMDSELEPSAEEPAWPYESQGPTGWEAGEAQAETDADQEAEELLSALRAAEEDAARRSDSAAEVPEAIEPELPGDWIPDPGLEPAEQSIKDPFDWDPDAEPDAEEPDDEGEFPEWLSLADEIDEMVSPPEGEEAEPLAEDQPSEPGQTPALDPEVEQELAAAYWAGTAGGPGAAEGSSETEGETAPRQAAAEGETAPTQAAAQGEAAAPAPTPAYEPEPGERYRVVLKGVQVRFPRRHCAHCYRSPAMKHIAVLANMSRGTMPQRELTSLRLPVCESCQARANAVSEKAQTARLQAHMLGALVALTLVVCSLVFRITDFQDGVIGDIVALIVLAALGYGVPMVLMMLRATRFPKPADALFVESTLRVPGDTEGMETAFEWRNRRYAVDFLEANQPIAVSEVTKVPERAPAPVDE